MPLSHQDNLLLTSATSGDLETLNAALAGGASIQIRNSRGGYTALHMATLNGHIAIVQRLLEVQANPQIRSFFDRTALHDAVSSHYLDIASLLLQKGADIDAPSSSGNTILHYIATQGDAEGICFLIQKGAQVQVLNQNNNSPLTLYLKFIRDRKESGNAIISREEYAVMQKTVQLLLDGGANLEDALHKLGIPQYQEALKDGHLFVGIQDSSVKNFLNDSQNTHSPHVEKTAYLSTNVLRKRYEGSSLSAEAIAKIQDEILLKAAQWGALWNEGNEKLLVAKTQDFLYHKMACSDDSYIPFWSSGLTMPQVVACIWKAIHDPLIRYQTASSLEQDIQTSEAIFFKAISTSNNCIQGGYFHPIIEACANSRVPGIYLIGIESQSEFVRDSIQALLDPLTAFEWVPEILTEEDFCGFTKTQVLTDDASYAAFMGKIDHNQRIYAQHGYNAQHLCPDADERFISSTFPIDDWDWLAPKELQTLQDRLLWPREQFKTALEEKKAIQHTLALPVSTEAEDRGALFSGLASQLMASDSPTRGRGWEALREYYSLARFHKNKKTFQQSLNAGRSTLWCLLVQKEQAEIAGYISDFFDMKQDELLQLNNSESALLFTPPGKRQQEDDFSELMLTPPRPKKRDRDILP